ncbi:hypothetical protein LOC67_24115 [Stieleria sp. JC731]|uniref:hypothetical protein n=1 Tax=Pirellulaceae TaxID=2691357 RepID=UPI001E61CD1A|nr:hypothetical protein [Stieleria sp. JC731]MCC9603646.1 hypothetical protein [Stieleria sp. JC731]
MPRFAFYLYILLTVPLIVGCEGCRQVSTSGGPSENDKAPKEAYSVGATLGYPADQNATFGALKPGHWMSAEQSLRSNQGDQRGELHTQATAILRDRDLNQIGTVNSIKTVRPVVLPEGQMRGFDFRFHVPLPSSESSRRISLSSRMVPSSGGILDTGGQPFVALDASEYFFVVLTTRPDRFTRFQTANWASFQSGNVDREVRYNNYRVVVPKVDGSILPLPDTMLDMSSFAVIFWDDVSADALTPMQQSAIADWVRFGGRFIINGADGSDAVANTSLLELMPLEPTSNIELDGKSAAEMMENHSVESDRSLAKQRNLVLSESSRIAVDGRLNSGAEPLEGTASLVLRKPFGRGAVIQPRFDLLDSWIQDWESYDSFVNNVILNRPARNFVVSQSAPSFSDGVGSLDENEVFPEDLELTFTGTRIGSDAAANTQFRLSSRDAILSQLDNQQGESKEAGSIFDRTYRVDGVGGLASWNDNSDIMQQMTDTLTSEAGIEIPDSALVIRSLLIYLIVLVPINYIVFRLMNRLEYAWFAVPVIAVIGAALAARQARLDIGFARSNTEIAFAEVYAGYPRAHLTRLMGIYNSLSSRYELQFPTADGIAMPLIDEVDPGTGIQPAFHVSFAEGPALVDFAVASNRMRFVHCEEMVDLGGKVTFSNDELVNDSDHELMDGVVVRRGPDGRTEAAVIGSLSQGESTAVNYVPINQISPTVDLPLKIDALMQRLIAKDSLPLDSTRLVCRIEGRIDGLNISPSASQSITQTVMLVHLEQPPFPTLETDRNLASSFARSVKAKDVAETPSGTDDTKN